MEKNMGNEMETGMTLRFIGIGVPKNWGSGSVFGIHRMRATSDQNLCWGH